MKRSIGLMSLIILLSCSEARSQWINSISISPQFPSSIDTIYIYADCSFPSGSCDQHIQGVVPNGNTLQAFATHCIGMLTFICNYTDTFKLDPLSPGNYLFDFQVNSGSLPSPCNPGIAPGPKDSLRFTVTSANFVHTLTAGAYSIYPNPSNGKFYLKRKPGLNPIGEESYFVYDPFGKVACQGVLHSQMQELDISNLNDGVYLLQINQGQQTSLQTLKLVLIH
jgi:hypothetical protein